MTSVVLITGLSAIALGGLFSAFSKTFTAGIGLQSAGAGCLALSGFLALAAGDIFGHGFSSALNPSFGLDGLSAFFLGLLGLVAAPALLFSPRYLTPSAQGRAIGTLIAIFLFAMAAVICARDPLTFLAGWESMTLISATVILVARNGDRRARQTVFTYLAVTHLGGVGTWIAILLLAQMGAIGDPSVIETGSGVQIAIALAALIGMGTKAGLMPMHVWLPRAHPIAPAPVSALMSGVMIKIAIYALIRVLVDWVGILPLWFGVVVLGIGVFSAIGGVTYALFQRDLKRLLALSSIENVGIIVIGVGACLIFRSHGDDTWAALALGAALLHTLNHGVFKALLFLGAGAFERAVGSLELDRLGGLLGRMRWTGVSFLIGAMAIAGLPPLNGFVSEWLTLQVLLRIPGSGGISSGIAGAFGLAFLAATAALAVYCFVKVVGLVLLGSPRRDAAAKANDVPLTMRIPIVFLAGVCVFLGLAPGLVFGSLVALAPWSEELSATSVSLGIELPGAGVLPTIGIAVVLISLTAGLLILRGRGRRAASMAPSWACGQLVHPKLNWTSAGFTKPLRLVLEGILRPEREITVQSKGGVAQHAEYSGRIPALIDERVYEPLARRSRGVAKYARRLQNGSLGTYVGYMIGLVVVLLGAARLGVIG